MKNEAKNPEYKPSGKAGGVKNIQKLGRTI